MASSNELVPSPKTLELIIGNMYSGKSKLLIERAVKAKKMKIPVFIFKPSVDNRSADLMSKAGQRIECLSLNSPKEILSNKELLKEKCALVLIDEVQFFDESIVYVLQYLVYKGNHVTAAGLDRDYRGQPFYVTGQLMVLADRIIRLYSKCSIKGCQNAGTRTQRIRNGKPDSLLSKTVEIEFVAEEVKYLAVCEEHHELPDFKEFIENKLDIELNN